MLAFVDESGDAGFKLDRGSSRLLVVAMVTFESAEEAQRCDDRIASLRADLSLPSSFEFHFSHNSRRVREAFLEAVRPYDFRVHVFAVDKANPLVGEQVRSSEDLQQLAMRELLEDAGPYLHNTTVVVDRAGTRQGRSSLVVHLRRRLSAGSLASIHKLKDQRSESHNLLQLADYVVGVSARVLNGHSDGSRLRSRHLQGREATWRVWP